MTYALVTGATGFIGRRLVRRLVDDGRAVRCLVRRDSERSVLEGLDVELVEGDVTCPETLGRAVSGASVVYHLAGATLTLRSNDFYRVNADGAYNVGLACADQASPPTMVFVSSLAAAGPAAGDDPRVETDPPCPVSHYGRSKRCGELRLEELADRLPITVLRPPGVFGPGDRYLLKLFRSVRRGWNVVPKVGRQRFSLIQVDDLAEAIIRAGEAGKRLIKPGPGESSDPHAQGYYFVAWPDAASMIDLGRIVAAAQDLPPPRVVHAPLALCWAAALGMEAVARLRRKQDLVNVDKIREAAAGSWVCSPRRAAEELQFKPHHGLDAGLAETAEWYQSVGWL